MSESLSARLKKGETIAAPGVGDALGAMLVAEAGFECIYVSGSQLAATRGWADVGFMALPDMVQALRFICDAVNVPVIADADDGYGAPISVIRTVREYERAGLTGLHIEDQHAHRCGSAAGVSLIPAKEMCAKVSAAVEAKTKPDFIVIARCDAANTAAGVDETIRRSREYRKAGADAIMVHGIIKKEDMQRCRDSIEGPLALTIGSRVDIPLEELRRIGYQLVIFPISTLRAQIATLRQVLTELKKNGGLDHTSSAFCPLADLQKFLGYPRYRAVEQKYGKLAEE
jgi:2,3-dimethylmalate lyase